MHHTNKDKQFENILTKSINNEPLTPDEKTIYEEYKNHIQPVSRKDEIKRLKALLKRQNKHHGLGVVFNPEYKINPMTGQPITTLYEYIQVLEYEEELNHIMIKDLHDEELTPEELAFVHQYDNIGVLSIEEELAELKALQKRIENGETSVVILDGRINPKTGKRTTSVSELIEIIEEEIRNSHE